jgi:hypothetical protein
VNNSDILDNLDLGTSVAENDNNLPDYFIQTVALNDFLTDRYDLIRGAKGSGKSAILKIAAEHSDRFPTLGDVDMVVATEHTGEPSFKRAFDLLDPHTIDEPDLVNAWKTYLINLALDSLEELPKNKERDGAIDFAEQCKLRFRTDSAFKKIGWSLLRMLHPKSLSVGMDKLSIDFPDAPPSYWTESATLPDFPEALARCVTAFAKAGRRCWILLDRLDAAFQHDRALETLALRSLLIAYKDFMGQVFLRPKIFLRTDLYDVVTTSGGFRELTHVADRTSPPITWDPDRLLQMIMERFAFNSPVCEKFGFDRDSVQDPVVRQAAFFSIFPPQIDSGSKKPDTWTWMCARIRDGNNVRTPRDLHALVAHSAQQQRQLLALGGETPAELITSPAVKRGLEQMSKDKVENTLLAENPDLRPAILAFQKQKAEQNTETIRLRLGEGCEPAVEGLVRIGFLERVGESWKVPMMYRPGLEITQGAAFEKGADSSGGDEED